MDVTFRESEPFYGEPTDLSLLFSDLDHLHSVTDGHEGEKDVSRARAQGASVGTNTNEDQNQPIVGTMQVGSLQLPLPVRDSPQIQIPVRDRWLQNPLVYSRRQPHVQGEQQASDDSSAETVGQRPQGGQRVWSQNLLVYSRRQPHVQGEQQGSDESSAGTVDLPIALRKGTREAARKGKVASRMAREVYRGERGYIGLSHVPESIT